MKRLRATREGAYLGGTLLSALVVLAGVALMIGLPVLYILIWGVPE